MSFTARHLRIVAPPAAIAVIALAGPALAHTVSSGHAAATNKTSTTKCFTITVKRKRVRECLVPGPRGPHGRRRARGSARLPRAEGRDREGRPDREGGTDGRDRPAGAGRRAGRTPSGQQGARGRRRARPVRPLRWPRCTRSSSRPPRHDEPVLRPRADDGVQRRHQTAAGSGVYCLTATGVSGKQPAADGVGESSYSYPRPRPDPARVSTRSRLDCPTGQYEVNTYDLSGGTTAPSNEVAFLIVIP